MAWLGPIQTGDVFYRLPAIPALQSISKKVNIYIGDHAAKSVSNWGADVTALSSTQPN